MADLLLTCSDGNIRWKFLFGSYIPRRRLESVILKYSIHTGAVTDRLTHILLKTLDSSALEPCRSTTPRTDDNSTHSCNSRFSNRDGDKEAKLMDCSFNEKYLSSCSIPNFKPHSDYTILAQFCQDLFDVGCRGKSYTTMGVGTHDSIVSSRVVCHSARHLCDASRHQHRKTSMFNFFSVVHDKFHHICDTGQ